MKERSIHQQVPFIPHDQATEVAQPGESALDLPASPIASQLPAVLGLGFPTIPAVRANQLKATIRQGLPERIGIVGLVGDYPLRPGLCLDRVEGAFRERDLGGRCRGKLASQRKTLAVDHHHPFRALAPFGSSHGIAPPLAGAKLPSKKASCQSNVPAASSWARKARHTSNQTPLSSHWRNRRQQVEALGYSSGRSAQGAPVRKIHSTPSSTSRWFRHGRPPRIVVGNSGNKGPILSHIASVRNCLRAMPETSMTEGLICAHYYHFEVMK
jgi:hypothetical protein